jgi:hypothetical protein
MPGGEIYKNSMVRKTEDGGLALRFGLFGILGGRACAIRLEDFTVDRRVQ